MVVRIVLHYLMLVENQQSTAVQFKWFAEMTTIVVKVALNKIFLSYGQEREKLNILLLLFYKIMFKVFSKNQV